MGEVVEAAYGGGETWYDAEVLGDDGKGNFTVFYIEDQEEEILTESEVRRKGGEAGVVGEEEERNGAEEKKLDLAKFEILAIMGDNYKELGNEDEARKHWSSAGDEAIRAGKSKAGMELKMKAEM